MPKNCYGVTLYTQELQAVRGFYEGVLELAVTKEVEGESITFDGGEVLITFEERYLKPPTLATLHFIEEDVPHFCKRLRMQGVPIREEWRDKVNLTDPEGRIVVLTEPPLG